jgi:hypothetical protein
MIDWLSADQLERLRTFLRNRDWSMELRPVSPVSPVEPVAGQ